MLETEPNYLLPPSLILAHSLIHAGFLPSARAWLFWATFPLPPDTQADACTGKLVIRSLNSLERKICLVSWDPSILLNVPTAAAPGDDPFQTTVLIHSSHLK